jgi:hypothetical protein
MARLSAKTEYRAMTSTMSELIWIELILTDLDIKHDAPIKIFYDNQAARHITLNLVTKEHYILKLIVTSYEKQFKARRLKHRSSKVKTKLQMCSLRD